MLSDAQLAEIRSRINPAYRDWPGCDSHERNLLVGEIDRLRGERQVLADLLHQAGDVLETMARSLAAESDARDPSTGGPSRD